MGEVVHDTSPSGGHEEPGHTSLKMRVASVYPAHVSGRSVRCHRCGQTTSQSFILEHRSACPKGNDQAESAYRSAHKYMGMQRHLFARRGGSVKRISLRS